MSDTKTMTKNDALTLVGEDQTDWFNYYKFSVSFSRKTDEYQAAIFFGGDADSVYRFELTPETSVSIANAISDEDACRITRLSDGAVFEIEGDLW